MFDVLVYLFENFYQTEQYPDQDTLTRKLSAAGFENEDINEALHWLKEITPRDDDFRTGSLDTSNSKRAFIDSECEKLSVEARGGIMFLESAGVSTPVVIGMVAAAALIVAGKADGLKHGAAGAAEAIDSGRARAVLERLVAVSNRG
jgi:Smg protein